MPAAGLNSYSPPATRNKDESILFRHLKEKGEKGMISLSPLLFSTIEFYKFMGVPKRPFRKRKGIIDFDRLIGLLGFATYDELKAAQIKWVESSVKADKRDKENKWTQSIAVGSKTFIEKIKAELGFRARGRKIIGVDDRFELREVLTPFGNAANPDSENIYLWNQ